MTFDTSDGPDLSKGDLVRCRADEYERRGHKSLHKAYLDDDVEWMVGVLKRPDPDHDDEVPVDLTNDPQSRPQWAWFPIDATEKVPESEQ